MHTQEPAVPAPSTPPTSSSGSKARRLRAAATTRRLWQRTRWQNLIDFSETPPKRARVSFAEAPEVKLVHVEMGAEWAAAEKLAESTKEKSVEMYPDESAKSTKEKPAEKHTEAARVEPPAKASKKQEAKLTNNGPEFFYTGAADEPVEEDGDAAAHDEPDQYDIEALRLYYEGLDAERTGTRLAELSGKIADVLVKCGVEGGQYLDPMRRLEIIESRMERFKQEEHTLKEELFAAEAAKQAAENTDHELRTLAEWRHELNGLWRCCGCHEEIEELTRATCQCEHCGVFAHTACDEAGDWRGPGWWCPKCLWSEDGDSSSSLESSSCSS